MSSILAGGGTYIASMSGNWSALVPTLAVSIGILLFPLRAVRRAGICFLLLTYAKFCDFLVPTVLESKHYFLISALQDFFNLRKNCPRLARHQGIAIEVQTKDRQSVE